MRSTESFVDDEIEEVGDEWTVESSPAKSGQRDSSSDWSDGSQSEVHVYVLGDGDLVRNLWQMISATVAAVGILRFALCKNTDALHHCHHAGDMHSQRQWRTIMFYEPISNLLLKFQLLRPERVMAIDDLHNNPVGSIVKINLVAAAGSLKLT